MSRDVPITVTRLLLLAADGSNRNEAVVAALKAAQLFKAEKLSLVPLDPKSEQCIMCQPATRTGQCSRCGQTGAGPGHPCSNPIPDTLCGVHATWSRVFVTQAPAAPPRPQTWPYNPGFGFADSPFQVNVDPFNPFGGSPFRGSYDPPPSPPRSPIDETERLRRELNEERMRSEKARLRASIAERDLELLRDEIAKKARPLTQEQEKKLFLPIEDMKIPTRALNALRSENITFVGELVQRSKRSLLLTKNVGRKSVREIEEQLVAWGMPMLGTKILDWKKRSDRWYAEQSRLDDVERRRSEVWPDEP